MVNPFPELFTYGFILGPLVLRLGAGSFLVMVGVHHVRLFRKYPVLVLLASLEIAAAVMLVVGIYVQVAALAGLLLSFWMIMQPTSFHPPLHIGRWHYIFLATISVSLMLLGAGGIAFDVPL